MRDTNRNDIEGERKNCKKEKQYDREGERERERENNRTL
jgi:hypothetical protein